MRFKVFTGAKAAVTAAFVVRWSSDHTATKGVSLHPGSIAGLCHVIFQV